MLYKKVGVAVITHTVANVLMNSSHHLDCFVPVDFTVDYPNYLSIIGAVSAQYNHNNPTDIRKCDVLIRSK